MKVLIIDSSNEIIKRLKELLAESDIVLKTYGTTSYKAGLLKILQIQPDTVILGVNLHSEESFNSVTEISNLNQNTSFIILMNSNEAKEKIKSRLRFSAYYLDKYHEFEKIPEVLQLIAQNLNQS